MERQPSAETPELLETIMPLTELYAHVLQPEQLMAADRQLYGETAETISLEPEKLALISANIFHQIVASVSQKYDKYSESPKSSEASNATIFRAIFTHRKQQGVALTAKTLVSLANLPIVTNILNEGRELQVGLLKAKTAFPDMPQAYDRLMFATFRDPKLKQLPDPFDVEKYQLAAGVGRQLAQLAWQKEILNTLGRVKDVRSITIDDIAIRFPQLSAEDIDAQVAKVPPTNHQAASKILFNNLEDDCRERRQTAYHFSLFYPTVKTVD
jgi:hypothetical protein